MCVCDTQHQTERITIAEDAKGANTQNKRAQQYNTVHAKRVHTQELVAHKHIAQAYANSSDSHFFNHDSETKDT